MNHNSFFENLAGKTSSPTTSATAAISNRIGTLFNEVSCTISSNSRIGSASSVEKNVADKILTSSDNESEIITIESETSASLGTYISNEQFKELLSRMIDVKEHLIRLEVKVDHYGRTSVPCGGDSPGGIGTVDMTKLRSCGVPISTKAELETLEKKLMDKNYKNELVSFVGTYLIRFEYYRMHDF